RREAGRHFDPGRLGVARPAPGAPAPRAGRPHLPARSGTGTAARVDSRRRAGGAAAGPRAHPRRTAGRGAAGAHPPDRNHPGARDAGAARGRARLRLARVPARWPAAVGGGRVVPADPARPGGAEPVRR
ncbi:hypothetical protein CIT14_22215, partial [Virgibacillus profundi]